MIGRITFLAAMTLLSAAGPALADPIEGRWKTGSGNLVEIAACGAAFCVAVASGPQAGKQIGRFEAQGDGTYAGTITDLKKNKTYNGKGSLSGNTLTMGGCVLGGLLCRNEAWSRQ